MDSTLEMFARKNSLHNKHKDSVFRISSNNTDGYVQHIEKISGESKVIVGTKRGTLSIFDYGGTETICIMELPYAHIDMTGLSVHHTAPSN